VLAIYPISTGYQIMGILHILAAVVAFGPMFLYPALHRAGELSTIAKLHMRMTFPALVVLWVLGMGLAGMSDKTFELSQTWLVLSTIIWLLMMLVSWFFIRPAVTDASERARSQLAMGTGVTHLLLVVALYLMIFKPGAPGGL